MNDPSHTKLLISWTCIFTNFFADSVMDSSIILVSFRTIFTKKILKKKFLKNAYSFLRDPLVNFFHQNFQKCLSLTPTNPQISFVTPYIGKFNSRQEGVNVDFHKT